MGTYLWGGGTFLGVGHTQQPTCTYCYHAPILDIGAFASCPVHAAASFLLRPAAAHQQPPANGDDVGGDRQNLDRGRVCGHLQNFTTSPMAHSWCWAKFLVLATELRCGWSLSDPGRRRQQGCSVTVGFRPFVQGRHPRHAPPTYGARAVIAHHHKVWGPIRALLIGYVSTVPGGRRLARNNPMNRISCSHRHLRYIRTALCDVADLQLAVFEMMTMIMDDLSDGDLRAPFRDLSCDAHTCHEVSPGALHRTPRDAPGSFQIMKLTQEPGLHPKAACSAIIVNLPAPEVRTVCLALMPDACCLAPRVASPGKRQKRSSCPRALKLC